MFYGHPFSSWWTGKLHVLTGTSTINHLFSSLICSFTRGYRIFWSRLLVSPLVWGNYDEAGWVDRGTSTVYRMPYDAMKTKILCGTHWIMNWGPWWMCLKYVGCDPFVAIRHGWEIYPLLKKMWLAGCNGSMDNPSNSIVGIPARFDDTGGWMEVSSWEGVATG